MRHGLACRQRREAGVARKADLDVRDWMRSLLCNVRCVPRRAAPARAESLASEPEHGLRNKMALTPGAWAVWGPLRLRVTVSTELRRRKDNYNFHDNFIVAMELSERTLGLVIVAEARTLNCSKMEYPQF